MARVPRFDLPGISWHLVQCGNDRQACFADDADYLRYRQQLARQAKRGNRICPLFFRVKQ